MHAPAGEPDGQVGEVAVAGADDVWGVEIAIRGLTWVYASLVRPLADIG
jgi:hypothetical protein